MYNIEFWVNKVKKYWTVNYKDKELEKISQEFRWLILLDNIKDIASKKNSIILDFWCWDWYFTDKLFTELNIDKHRLYWFDIVNDNIIKIKNKWYKNFIKWDINDFISNINNNIKFDCIYTITVLQHILDDKLLIENLTKVYDILKKWWKLILIEWFWNWYKNHFLIKRKIKDFIEICSNIWFKLKSAKEIKIWWLYLIKKIRIKFIRKLLLKFLFLLYKFNKFDIAKFNRKETTVCLVFTK